MSRFADPDNLNFPECSRRHLTSALNSDLCPRRSDPDRTDRTAVGRQCSAINGNHFAIELSSRMCSKCDNGGASRRQTVALYLELARDRESPLWSSLFLAIT